MSDSAEVLDRVGAALRAGDSTAFVACFGIDGVLVVPYAGGELSFDGAAALSTALSTVLNAFTDVSYAPVRRYVTPTQTVEEATLSGLHVGSFLGHLPSGERIRVNVRLVGEVTTDETLRRLAIWADLPSLWIQLGESVTVADAANAAVSAARGLPGEELRVMHGADRTAGVAAVTPPVRRRNAARSVTIATIALLAATAVATAAFAHRAEHKSDAAQVRGSGSASTLPGALSGSSPGGQASGLPAIATASAVPTVQPGLQLVLSADVLFDFASGTLTPDANKAVLQLASRIRKAQVHGVIQINGYTDNVGPDDYDVALSQMRALAVAKALQQQLSGVPVTLVPQGFGKTNPVASNNTEAGRARNRRVTIVLPANR